MYKIETHKEYHTAILQSNKWKVILSEVKGHIHVRVRGPNNYRKQGLSNVKSDLSQFEMKVTALYFYRLARKYGNHVSYHGYVEPVDWIEYQNYAAIFGSLFD